MRRQGKKVASRRYGRLKLVVSGLALILAGTARMLKGVQVVLHANGQPMFSWGLVAGGTVCLVLAVVPLSWIRKAASVPVRGRSLRP